MAKRRRKTIKKGTRVVYRNKKRKAQGTMSKAMRFVIPVGYGFLRDRINDAVMKSSIGQQIPITNFTDEGVMLGAGYLASAMGLTKNNVVRQLVSHSRTIELSNIGRTMSDLQQTGKSYFSNPAGSNGQTGVQNAFVYS